MFISMYNLFRNNFYRKEENTMYDFRIILCADGTEIIDRSLKTPYSTLTPAQMAEYQEMNIQIAISDRMKRKAQREEEERRKRERNLLYRLACLCGIV